MTRINNLGFQSEFIISQLEANLIEKPEYCVLQTPTNPNYYFGNLLALNVPLSRYQKHEWLALFNSEFANMPNVDHVTLSWVRTDSEDIEAIAEFTRSDFEFEETHILTLERKKFQAPSALNENMTYRPLTSPSDWSQWIELSIQENTGDHSEEGLRQYLNVKAENYQHLAKENLGEYLGAFKGNQLIGYAGLYHRNDLARFQNVHVVPEHQNQKIASTLLVKLIKQAPETIETLVIVADEHYHATQLYQSLGFSIAERECSLCWWPKSQRKPTD